MKSFYKNPDDDEDGMSALLDAKMNVKKAPAAPQVTPSSPVAPRQNFAGPPQPLAPTKPQLPPNRGQLGAGLGKPGGITAPLPPPPPVTHITAPVAAQEAPSTPAGPPKTDDEAALDALAAELDHQSAQNQAGAASKAGLGGFGLSGGSAAMAADVGTHDANERVLALQDLMNQQKDQSFQDTQHAAAVAELEDAAGVDINGDGKIGYEAFEDGHGPSHNDDADGNGVADNANAKSSGNTIKQEGASQGMDVRSAPHTGDVKYLELTDQNGDVFFVYENGKNGKNGPPYAVKQ